VYYGLFSKSMPFIEVAARLLFHELTPTGSLPVSVSGIGYDLLSATAPNPNQVIDLSVDLPVTPISTLGETPELTATPLFKVGDTITIKTGVILDHNNRPVPDGTGVRFTLTSTVEGNIIQVVDAITNQGIARTFFGINQPGLIEIRANIEPSVSSVVLQLDITNEGISVTVVAPTQVTPDMTKTTELDITPTPISSHQPESMFPGFSSWIFMIVIISITSFLAFFSGLRLFSLKWGIRWALCVILGSLIVYNFSFLGVFGNPNWMGSTNLKTMSIIVLIGATLGWGSGLIWTWLSLKQGTEQTDDQ
jgi:beta-N-acetylhexosaminidase